MGICPSPILASRHIFAFGWFGSSTESGDFVRQKWSAFELRTCCAMSCYGVSRIGPELALFE
jgi:hypothetical protein